MNRNGGSSIPKISITVSDYTYWRLLGSGESVSRIIQKALKDYWKESQKKGTNISSVESEK